MHFALFQQILNGNRLYLLFPHRLISTDIYVNLLYLISNWRAEGNHSVSSAKNIRCHLILKYDLQANDVRRAFAKMAASLSLPLFLVATAKATCILFTSSTLYGVGVSTTEIRCHSKIICVAVDWSISQQKWRPHGPSQFESLGEHYSNVSPFWVLTDP